MANHASDKYPKPLILGIPPETLNYLVAGSNPAGAK
jgi:hypothetical protein